MIEILTQLRVLWAQSGKSQQTIADRTGFAKSTVSNILSGKSEDVRLQTVIDIAAELDAEIALISEQSKKAISQQDVSYYRDELANRDNIIAELKAKIAELTAQCDRPDLVAALAEKNALLEAVRAESQLKIDYLRKDVEFCREQIAKKDRLIDMLAK